MISLALWGAEQLTCLREMVVLNRLTLDYILGFLAWKFCAFPTEPNFTLQLSGSETVATLVFQLWLLPSNHPAHIVMWWGSQSRSGSDCLDLTEAGKVIWPPAIQTSLKKKIQTKIKVDISLSRVTTCMLTQFVYLIAKVQLKRQR